MYRLALAPAPRDPSTSPPEKGQKGKQTGTASSPTTSPYALDGNQPANQTKHAPHPQPHDHQQLAPDPHHHGHDDQQQAQQLVLPGASRGLPVPLPPRSHPPRHHHVVRAAMPAPPPQQPADLFTKEIPRSFAVDIEAHVFKYLETIRTKLEAKYTRTDPALRGMAAQLVSWAQSWTLGEWADRAEAFLAAHETALESYEHTYASMSRILSQELHGESLVQKYLRVDENLLRDAMLPVWPEFYAMFMKRVTKHPRLLNLEYLTAPEHERQQICQRELRATLRDCFFKVTLPPLRTLLRTRLAHVAAEKPKPAAPPQSLHPNESSTPQRRTRSAQDHEHNKNNNNEDDEDEDVRPLTPPRKQQQHNPTGGGRGRRGPERRMDDDESESNFVRIRTKRIVLPFTADNVEEHAYKHLKAQKEAERQRRRQKRREEGDREELSSLGTSRPSPATSSVRLLQRRYTRTQDASLPEAVRRDKIRQELLRGKHEAKEGEESEKRRRERRRQREAEADAKAAAKLKTPPPPQRASPKKRTGSGSDAGVARQERHAAEAMALLEARGIGGGPGSQPSKPPTARARKKAPLAQPAAPDAPQAVVQQQPASGPPAAPPPPPPNHNSNNNPQAADGAGKTFDISMGGVEIIGGPPR